jgi:hypothetical protein
MAESPPVPGSEPIAAAPKGTTVEALLTPTGPPVDGLVQLGNLRVQSGIFDDFKKAQEYVGKSSEAVSQLYGLVHGRTEVDVRSTDVGRDEFGGRDGKPTISWAPQGALLNTDGSQLSAAMGLLHEEGHANRWLSDPAAYARDTQHYPNGSAEQRTWTTPEERRNITGLEHRVAAELGEGRRDDHHGQPYTAHGPVSIESEGHHLVAERIAELKAQGINAPPVANDIHAVVAYDHRAHTGSFVNIGRGEVAQHIGRGQYMVYNVESDLHKIKPPEGVILDVDAKGQMPRVQEPTHGYNR